MKNILKQNKGISLVSLSIAIIILVIVTNILVYNARDSIHIKSLTNMYNDIANLRGKISTYYSTYGEIPVKVKYEDEKVINTLEEAGVIGANDETDEFYVIELSAIDGLTLNLGKDYGIVEDEEPEVITEEDELKDIYIINKNSHNIFYAQGVSGGDGNLYYTDDKNIDKAKVDLRYVDGVKIPDGFYYCGGTKEEGIVISDMQGDDLQNTKQGNQFVWVPVENFEEFVREDFGTQNIQDSDFINTEPTEEKYYEPSANGKDETNEVEEMYKSVKEYKGFYIARFEAGNESSQTVSKKGATVYNNIKWGNSLEDETGGAVEAARGMYPSDNTQYGVTSTLCYGVQWDAVMRWISKDDELSKYLTNSTEKGNYGTGAYITTGENPQFQIKNIYDMTGNVCEWTMEDIYNSKVYRGGSYQTQYNGSDHNIARRSRGKVTEAYSDLGFRVTLYLEPEEQWSEVYNEAGTYTDEEKEEAYIPAGFKVSLSPYENKINNGLVIKNANTGDEYVWIKVPEKVLKNIEGDTNIEETLKEYTEDYRKDGYEDTWYNGCGLTEAEYNELKSKMLQSIKENSGFYIGRYEAGLDDAKTSGSETETIDSLISTNGLPKSQIGKYPYNYVTCNQAQQLASKLSEGQDYNSSLMFGIQWNLACKFIEETQAKNKNAILQNSSSWGNYSDSEFTLMNGKYNYNNLWKNISENIENVVENKIKIKSSSVICTTGASKQNKVLNIYDLSGNLWETVLAKKTSNNENGYVTNIGGSADNSGTSSVIKTNNGILDKNISFRVAIY